MKLRKRWDRKRVSARTVETPPNVRTQQQFKDECDINVIVKHAMRGVPPRFMARGTPQYGDFSELPESLDQAYALIDRAQEAFMALPAELRRELDNDPRGLERITLEQAQKYGLTKAPPPEKGESEAEPAPLASPPPQAAPKPSKKGKAANAAPPPGEGEE